MLLVEMGVQQSHPFPLGVSRHTVLEKKPEAHVREPERR